MTTYSILPYENSFGRAVVGGKVFFFSFDYNSEGDFWSFGLWQNEKTLIYSTKLVKGIPLNAFFKIAGAPEGYFECVVKGDGELTKDAVLSGAVALIFYER